MHYAIWDLIDLFCIDKAKDKKDTKMQDSKDDPKAGADVGKIVNLMAVDASKVPRCLIQRKKRLLTNCRGM